MKLLRLKLDSDFRSLRAGFEVDFLREWDRDRFDEFHPYCLVGRNGSGKSNVLEALAAIFYHIESIYLGDRPDDFEQNQYKLFLIPMDSGEELPKKEQSAVCIAKNARGLAVRIFDQFGAILFDGTETELQDLEKVENLKSKLGPFLDRDETIFSQDQQWQIVEAALVSADIPNPGFCPQVSEPDAFELEYLIPDLPSKRGKVIAFYKGQLVAHIRIAKEVGQSPVIRYAAGSPDSKEPGEELSRQEVPFYLPQYVLGYSSGHNEILSLPFFKMRLIHFDEYRDKLIQRVDYPGRPEGRMIYLDDQFSQVILLCHFLFPSEAITRVFKDRIDLEGFRCFRLIIRRFHRIELEQAPSANPASAQESKPKETAELTENLSGIIDKLIKCATTCYEDRTPYPDDDDAHDLYIDYWIDDDGEARRAFHTHFADSTGGSEELNKAASALNLFHAFQTLLTLNYYKVDPQTKQELYESASLYVNETIPTPASHERIARFKDSRILKPGVNERIYLKALSDGEHQLLHTIGLCLLFRHKPALFLLDEPETHLNPDWRASYISTLRAALEADEATKNVMREVLLTSHSPFIISDCRKENVLVFSKDPETREVTWARPDFETFGASANAITIKVFGQTETIGDYAMKTITAFRQRLDAGEDPDKLIKEVGKELGDSVEKVLFVNQALNRKEDK
ncbi:restriction system-associated AAA family ATPase [Luteolibacter pohnpeiensis]|uniref:Restriction system-associated AAA family ATPase n=1 Tax=Luteolibacter pohnpeiensis TaxID=454153 RepID=A0A934VWZ2_9BACT|nr:restriction system-associated AAA family ATPase [Luteolibacter pohnpeiensis]MBK1883790.1 restriction system-associated AAA family ATPase [Luteolibacter pohnpeiensis]